MRVIMLFTESELVISNKSFTKPNKRAHLMLLLKLILKLIFELIVNLEVMPLNDTTKLLLFVVFLFLFAFRLLILLNHNRK